MAKYHVSDDGTPRPCSARPGNCRYGSDSEHYDSPEAAVEGYAEKISAILESVDRTRRDYASAKEENERLVERFAELCSRAEAGDEGVLSRLSEEHEKLRQSSLEMGRKAREADVAHHKGYEVGVLDEPAVRPVEGTYMGKMYGTKSMPIKNIIKHNEIDEDRQKVVARAMSALSGKSMRECRDIMRNAQGDPDGIDNVVQVFKESSGKNKKGRIYYDLETTGIDPTMGEIIQIGIIRTDKDGNVVERIDETFGMENDEYRERFGTGPEDIHNISREMVKGKPKFSDPEVQERMKRILNDPDYVGVAYNDIFEHSWLSTHLEGFWDAHSQHSPETLRNEGNPRQASLDPTTLFRSTIPRREGSRLKHFAEYNDVDYENAHNAYADSEMMHRALVNFEKKLQE